MFQIIDKIPQRIDEIQIPNVVEIILTCGFLLILANYGVLDLIQVIN